MPHLKLNALPILVARSKRNIQELLVSRTSIGNCERIGDGLASMCETIQHSFETDTSNASLSFCTNLLRRHELWTIKFESQGKEKKVA